ncbi:flagellar export chaperone FliS [Hydrogenophaga sp.]|uniref:flagellar export chaperone FliS n=1 Tax=Hydrogenophaga sp. TaxID=1904254 RepID=UPI003569374C
MFTSVNSRAASAYKRVSAETSVQGANPHQLVALLFEALLQSIQTARGAMARGDVQAKGEALGKAVRILEEGLKAGLNLRDGGEIASNLQQLYSYCVTRLTQANLRNDPLGLDEAQGLIEPVAQSWKQIQGSTSVHQPAVPVAGA